MFLTFPLLPFKQRGIRGIDQEHLFYSTTDIFPWNFSANCQGNGCLIVLHLALNLPDGLLDGFLRFNHILDSPEFGIRKT